MPFAENPARVVIDDDATDGTASFIIAFFCK
jgi:hypothetical protein